MVIFFWSPFLMKRSRKTPQKLGENSEQNSAQNSGRKFEKFVKLSLCNFSRKFQESHAGGIGSIMGNLGHFPWRMRDAQDSLCALGTGECDVLCYFHGESWS